MKKEEDKRKRTIFCDDLDASRNPSILACVCLSLSLSVSLPPSLSHFVIILFIYVLWGHAPCQPACVQPTCSCHFNNTFNVLPASTSADAFHL